ncbi:hypothetical protein MDAP_002864 [Mitosporidium daphniae]
MKGIRSLTEPFMVGAGRRLASYSAKGRTVAPRINIPKITSRNTVASAFRSVAEPLQKALFETAGETLAARANIDAVERKAMQHHQIAMILSSRQKALDALKEISPKLHALATDPSLIRNGVPLERRMLTMTPPAPDVAVS